MGFKQAGPAQENAVFARFNGSTGQFVVNVAEGTPGAKTRAKTKGENIGELVHELHFNALDGVVSGLKLSTDEKYGNTLVHVAMKNPGEDPAVASFTLRGENGLSKTVIAMLQALSIADLSAKLRMSIAYQPAGTKFTAKDGNEVVREFGQSTVFVGLDGVKVPKVGADGKSKESPHFYPVDRSALPEVKDILVKGVKKGEDDTDLEDYAAGLITVIRDRLDALRKTHDEALDSAPSQTPTEDFGVSDAVPCAEDEAGARFGS